MCNVPAEQRLILAWTMLALQVSLTLDFLVSTVVVAQQYMRKTTLQQHIIIA